MPHTAVILAAGKGTRMKSDLPKVMHRVAGRPMIAWVLDAIATTGPERVVVVVGHGADLVIDSLPPLVETCVQADQRGTGHAVEVALEHLGVVAGDVLVVPGDTPLITGSTLLDLLDKHRSEQNTTTILSTVLEDPFGYGRIVRGPDGSVEKIVEQRDADNEIASIAEVNAGMYVFDLAKLAGDISNLEAENSQGEYYLTDVVATAVGRGDRVGAAVASAAEAVGVNTHRQLAEASERARIEINGTLMDAGVSIQDPTTTFIDADVTVEPGAMILANVHLTAGTIVRSGARIGPDCYLEASKVGEGSRVWYAVLRSATVGPNAEVGPYVSLRPEAVLEEGAKAGTFVEIKNSVIGPGAKVPHLSYIGDADIGARSNVGAGTITVNYNGYEKFRTRIGADVKIGSDTMLVAPVSIGDGAMTAAGSVITEDVESDAMAFGRARQVNKAGFAARLRARYRGDSGQ